MKMEDFHCGTLELSFGIGAKQFNKAAFFKETGSEETDELDVYLAFDSEENPGQQHSHVSIQSRPEDKIEVHISYHDSDGKVEDENSQPPRMEECAKWVGKLIKSNKVKALITATYFFDKTYALRVKLPYSFKLPEKALEGGIVTGLFIYFPAGSQLDHAIVQHSRDVSKGDFGMSVAARAEIAIRKFDLYEELKRLEPSVMALVRKRGRHHAKRQKE